MTGVASKMIVDPSGTTDANFEMIDALTSEATIVDVFSQMTGGCLCVSVLGPMVNDSTTMR